MGTAGRLRHLRHPWRLFLMILLFVKRSDMGTFVGYKVDTQNKNQSLPSTYLERQTDNLRQ